jgi:hypothetical protein
VIREGQYFDEKTSPETPSFAMTASPMPGQQGIESYPQDVGASPHNSVAAGLGLSSSEYRGVPATSGGTQYYPQQACELDGGPLSPSRSELAGSAPGSDRFEPNRWHRVSELPSDFSAGGRRTIT